MNRLLILFPVVLVAFALAQVQEPPPGTTAPGLKLTIQPPNGAPDARVARLIALSVPHGAPASPFVPAGPFTARFEGFINVRIRTDYVFSAEGLGALELLINGENVLEVAGDDLSGKSSARVRLRRGPNAIVVRYKPPAAGPARLRLLFAERDALPQPIPPTMLSHDPGDSTLVESSTRRAGRELVVELRCIRCHVPPDSAAGPHAMPELAMDAPSLDGIGSRVNVAWMVRWIADPKLLRPDATMPRVLRETKDAADIAAYLATLRDDAAPLEPQFAPDDADAGGHLFVGLGCVACHTLERDSPDERISLAGIKAKRPAGALVDFLKSPHARYAWNPMPDFQLSDDEARRLAAFLLARASDPLPAPAELSDADLDRGRALVRSSGCLNCHTLDDANSELKAEPLAQLADGGCLSGQAAAGADYALPQDAREQIRAFLRTDLDALARDTPAEFAERRIRATSCTACHSLDGQPDRWSALGAEVESLLSTLKPLADEPEGDQSRPTLTWAGEKLRAQWMRQFLAAEIPYKPRPWLVARMPAFPARAELLAEGMLMQHGYMSGDAPEPPVDPELATIGRRLVGKDGGFACNTCHAVGAADATSPFEAHGPNLMYTTVRMREEFYHRWVGDPLRYEPGTRMPQYADMDGKTALRDVLDGDARRQFEAIWHYLRAGEAIDPPQR